MGYYQKKKTLIARVHRFVRAVINPRYNGDYYLTDGSQVWLHIPRRVLKKGEPFPIGEHKPTAVWRGWVEEHDRIIFWRQDSLWAMLKRETYYRISATGERMAYSYWRGYAWPMRRHPPVRVWLGHLERLNAVQLNAKMSLLEQRYTQKRAYYLAEKARRRKRLLLLRGRRYRRRYRERHGYALGHAPKARAIWSD